MRVFDSHMNFVGSITKKFDWMNVFVEVSDADDQPVYVIRAKKYPGW